jgi:5-methyltetrahydropteroyltriglutamate--homocysteine methyltransferase
MNTLFPATVCGSLPKPAWLSETNKLWPRWLQEGDALVAAKNDATTLWVKEQEDAGLSIIGDGEQSRQHFVHGFLEFVQGIDFEHKVGGINRTFAERGEVLRDETLEVTT